MGDPDRFSPLLRILLAWAVTLAVLAYAWGRVIGIALLVGRPEALYLLLLAVGVLGVMVLTRGLPTEPGRRGRIGAAVLGSWIVFFSVLIVLYNGPVMPTAVVAPVFVAASLWVPWLAWLFFWPLGAPARWGTLVLLLAVAGGCLAALHVEGLTGDARLNFAWRWQTTPPLARPGAGAEADHPTADLTRTTDHDYPQYLGPDRLGVLPAARLARDWEHRPPRPVWRIPVGVGWGSFAVVGNYALTQEQRGEEECVVCYRLADGTACWTQADPVRFDSSLGGPGPRATPTVAGGLVYTVGATGLLNCLDGATGRVRWAVNILQDNGAGSIAHGVCASPLVLDDLVLVCPTGEGGPSLVAYRRETGERVWRGGQDQASYGSPLVAELAGVRQVLLATSAGIAAHEPATGRLLWRFPWTNSERINCCQPFPNAGGPGQVLIATGYGKGSALARAEPSADGSWTVQAVWESRQLKAKFTSAVVRKGFAYGLDDGILQCLDLKTGKSRWKDGRYGHGQVLLAGDLLLVQAENGSVVLVEAVPDGLHELGRLPALTGKTWNHPALAGHFLLVRNDHEAACYELALEE